MIQKLKKILKGKVARNASWLIFGRIIQMILSLFVGILSARYLGPENYGLISYVSAYTTFFMSFCTLGINSVLVKEILDHKDDEGLVLGTNFVLRLISSFFSSAAIVLIVSIVDKGESNTFIISVILGIGLIVNVFDSIQYWFQAKLRSKYVAMATLLAYVLVVAYRIVLLILNKSVFYFAFATVLDYLLLAGFLFFQYFRQEGQPFRFSRKYARELLLKSRAFILPSLMVAIYSQTDHIMLKQMIGESENGYYAIAVNVCNMWCFVLSAIIESFAPTIIEAYKNNVAEFNKKNRQLYCLVFYMCLAVSLAFMVLASPVISILYGEAYLGSVNPLRIVTWYTAFSYLGVARDVWVVCKERQKYLLPIYVVSAVLNVILNFVFIPLRGASGAAVASLITQFITIFGVPFCIKNMRENSLLILDAIFFRDVF